MQPAPSASKPPGRNRRHSQPKAQSVPFKRPYVEALLFSAAFYLALVGTAAALFAFIAVPNKNSASLLIGFAGFSALLWLFSFLKRRCCICPLCKSTPLLDNSAHRHEKALRFFPLNHGNTNVIRAIVRQNFRCQYCGTPFDLLKPIPKYQTQPAPLPPFVQPRFAAQSIPPPAPEGADTQSQPVAGNVSR